MQNQQLTYLDYVLKESDGSPLVDIPTVCRLIKISKYTGANQIAHKRFLFQSVLCKVGVKNYVRAADLAYFLEFGRVSATPAATPAPVPVVPPAAVKRGPGRPRKVAAAAQQMGVHHG